jgi:hypothetical protein
MQFTRILLRLRLSGYVSLVGMINSYKVFVGKFRGNMFLRNLRFHTVMHVPFAHKTGNLLTSRATFSFMQVIVYGGPIRATIRINSLAVLAYIRYTKRYRSPLGKVDPSHVGSESALYFYFFLYLVWRLAQGD